MEMALKAGSHYGKKNEVTSPTRARFPDRPLLTTPFKLSNETKYKSYFALLSFFLSLFLFSCFYLLLLVI